MLETGIAWLQAQRHEHLTVPIVYSRAAHSVTLQATRGTSEFGEMGADASFQLGYESRDFIFRKADLVLNNLATLPQRLDTIDDGGRRFIVTAPQGQPPFRYSDHEQTTVRVYARLQGATP